MLLATGPPGSGDWVVEAKWDGMRALVDTGAGDWRGWSRHGTPITGWFPELAHLEAAVGGRRAVLDGEVICLDHDGRPSFRCCSVASATPTGPAAPGRSRSWRSTCCGSTASSSSTNRGTNDAPGLRSSP